MKNKRKLFILVGFSLFGFMIFFSGAALAQCNLKVESKVERSDSNRGGDIFIKVKRGSGKIDFYLIDLKNPKKGPLRKESRPSSEFKGDFVLLFKNVPPSVYSIQVIDSKKCQVSVGGIEGITITEN